LRQQKKEFIELGDHLREELTQAYPQSQSQNVPVFFISFIDVDGKMATDPAVGNEPGTGRGHIRPGRVCLFISIPDPTQRSLQSLGAHWPDQCFSPYPEFPVLQAFPKQQPVSCFARFPSRRISD